MLEKFKRFFVEFPKNKKAVLVTAISFSMIILIIVLTAVGLRTKQTAASAGDIIGITAIQDSDAGVRLNSDFVVNCSAGMSDRRIKESMVVSPDLPYTLKRQDADSYLLKFKDDLPAGTVVSFKNAASSRSYSWAFQTENTFRVTSTLPADKAVDVPVRTGIEITLSYLDAQNFESCFKIEPSVKGRFEQHGKRMAFVPDGLSPNTLYKVTLSKQLKTAGGKQLSEDCVFSFRTQRETKREENFFYTTGNFDETFTPEDTPVIELGASEKYNNTDFLVQVFSLADEDAYAGILKERRSYIKDQLGYAEDFISSGKPLSSVMKFESKVGRQYSDDVWRPAYIVFPEKLTNGWYLVDITEKQAAGNQGVHVQKLIQIHSYSVYALSVNSGELIWVNDTETGQPVEGAAAELSGAAGKTAADGTARFDVAESEETGRYDILTVKKEQQVFVAEVRLGQKDKQDEAKASFYSYIYTDREKYQPADTVSVWGVLLPKDGKGQIPKTAQLKLKEYEDGNVLEQAEVKLDKQGAFSGKMSLQGLASDIYYLSLTAGDTTYYTKYIDVAEYVKPAYNISTSLDKPFYFGWEPINLSAAISFFDGTPAANIPFSIYCTGNSQANEKSSSSGSVTRQFRFNDTEQSWHPTNLQYEVSSAGAEDQQAEKWGSITVLPRDTMMNYTVSRSEAGFSVDVETNRIDTGKISSADELYDTESIKGAPLDIPIVLKIFEITWTKTQTGTYYDPINRIVVPEYDYDRSKKQIDQLSGTSLGGKITFSGLKYIDSKEKNYYAEIECTDSRGKAISETVSFFGSSNYYYNSDSYTKSYQLSLSGPNEVGKGETARVDLNCDGEPVPKGGKLLYAAVQTGIRSYAVTDEPSFNYTFQEGDIPNVSFAAAYFDGKKIYSVSREYLYYKSDEMRLNVEITAEETKAPGEEAKIKLAVTDSRGKPVSGASVCASVVDEAAFAIAEQSADPLSDIYTKYIYTDFYDYTSYVPHDPESLLEPAYGGEGGSEGNVRKNFVDTAAFLTATSDRNGVCEFSFKLPDNVTSWRVTGLAAAKGVYAGTARADIKSTLPFFADVIVSRQFIKGDDLSVAVRAVGTGVKENDSVNFEAVLRGSDGAEKSLSGKAKTGVLLNLNFGKAQTGDYTVTVTAKSKAGTDGVEKSFKVVESTLQAPVVKSYSLSDGLSINALRYPVTLTFWNGAQEQIANCRYELATACGSRADTKISSAAAQKILQEQYGDSLPYYLRSDEGNKPVLGEFQTASGGARLLPYGDEDTQLTAKLCAAAPEYMNTKTAASYLWAVIDKSDSKQEDIAAAYMGLASLKEPVLLDIRYLLKSNTTLGLSEKLYLIAGLAFAGDLDGAKKSYNEIVSPLIARSDNWVYVNSGKQREDDISLTALALMMQAAAGENDARGMADFLLNNQASEEEYFLEKLVFIRNYRKSDPQTASFSYMEDGKLKEVKLEKEPYMLSLNEAQLKAADFKVVQGDIGVTAAYIGGINEVSQKAAELVTLKKTIEPAASVQTDLVKIIITPTFAKNAPTGPYQLSDVIPAGMRYTSDGDRMEGNWWLQDIEGQNLRFYVFNVDKKDKSQSYMSVRPIVYYARATLTGGFVSESAYIKHISKDAWGISERKDVTIGEK